MIWGSILALLYSYLTDPNGGALTVALLGQLATPILAVWFAYLARKALTDYVDLEEVFRKAKESTVGAGLVFLGICLLMYGLLGLFGNQVRAQPVESYIPPPAVQYIETVKNEQTVNWPDHPKVIYLQR